MLIPALSKLISFGGCKVNYSNKIILMFVLLSAYILNAVFSVIKLYELSTILNLYPPYMFLIGVYISPNMYLHGVCISPNIGDTKLEANVYCF